MGDSFLGQRDILSNHKRNKSSPIPMSMAVPMARTSFARRQRPMGEILVSEISTVNAVHCIYSLPQPSAVVPASGGTGD